MAGFWIGGISNSTLKQYFPIGGNRAPAHFDTMNHFLIKYHIFELTKLDRRRSSGAIHEILSFDKFGKYYKSEYTELKKYFIEAVNSVHLSHNEYKLDQFRTHTKSYEEKVVRFMKNNIRDIMEAGASANKNLIKSHNVKDALILGDVRDIIPNLIFINSSSIAEQMREIQNNPEFGKKDFSIHYVLSKIPDLYNEYLKVHRIGSTYLDIVSASEIIPPDEPRISTQKIRIGEEKHTILKHHDDAYKLVTKYKEKIFEYSGEYEAMLREYSQTP